jgi:hypothetical protein
LKDFGIDGSFEQHNSKLKEKIKLAIMQKFLNQFAGMLDNSRIPPFIGSSWVIGARNKNGREFCQRSTHWFLATLLHGMKRISLRYGKFTVII